MILGLVFDIDDTLYHEREYVRSGFAQVAGLAGTSDEEVSALSGWLWAAFESGIRGDTFDRLFVAFPALGDRMSISDLVQAYREHAPQIELIPGMADTLDALHQQGVRLGVLSDGPAASQSRKVAALGLDRWFDPIVLTGALGARFAKPARAGFERIAEEWGLAGSTLGYIADNPSKDFTGPNRLGWLTIRLRRPGQLHFSVEPTSELSQPDVEVGTAAELLRLRRAKDPHGPITTRDQSPRTSS